jgi:hypothetical protein
MDTDSLIRSLAAEGPRRALPPVMKQVALWLGGTGVWLAGLVAFEGLRPDIGAKMAEPFYLAELVLLFALAVSLACTALFLSRPDGLQRMGFTRFAPPVLLAACAVAAFLDMRPSGTPSLAQIFDPHQFDCVGCILLFCLPPGLTMMLMVRRGAPVYSLRAGAFAAASAASLAYLCMRLIEANDNPFHVLIWHALPVLILSLIGMVAGRKLFAWR